MARGGRSPHHSRTPIQAPAKLGPLAPLGDFEAGRAPGGVSANEWSRRLAAAGGWRALLRPLASEELAGRLGRRRFLDQIVPGSEVQLLLREYEHELANWTRADLQRWFIERAAARGWRPLAANNAPPSAGQVTPAQTAALLAAASNGF